MTACDGCGSILGFKKYKFHRMWRIEGKYCNECMLKLGKEFDRYGRITLPKKSCDLCNVNFYFLKSTWSGKQQRHYCHTCNEAVSNGVIPNRSKNLIPSKVPKVMMIFAALGILMMALGLFYTVSVGSSGQGNIIGILFGSTTTAMGFVLFKKTVKSRSLILGKTKSSPASTSAGYQKENTKPPY